MKKDQSLLNVDLNIPQRRSCIFCPIDLDSACTKILFFIMCLPILCGIHAFCCKSWPLSTNNSNRKHTVNELNIQVHPFTQFSLRRKNNHKPYSLQKLWSLSGIFYETMLKKLLGTRPLQESEREH